LVIQEQGHKGDQTGSEKYWKHVYANPHDPEVCPVLAMAVLIFAGPPRTTAGRQQLFLGSNSKDRFAKQLNQVIRGLTEAQLQTLAQDRSDIGPYSLRKGSASYCLGQTSGPNPVTVPLRMGHSLGKVNDAYYLEQCILCAEPRILPAGIEHIRRLDMSAGDRLFAIVYRALVEKLYSVEGEIENDINMARKGELSSENDVDGHIVSKRRRT
jgi:hypothetical protein